MQEAASVRTDNDFVERLVRAAVAGERVFEPSEHVELQIYGRGFLSDTDSALSRRFHISPWEERLTIALQFDDQRLRRLARRLIYFERPDLLDEKQRQAMDNEISRRVRGGTDEMPWRTIPRAIRLPEASGRVFDPERNHYTCPQGKLLVQFRRSFRTPRSGVTKDGTRLYRASKSDCQACTLKPRCCPNTPHRKVPRDLDEDARDFARTLARTPAFERSRHLRKKIEMLFAHLKRILRVGRLRLRGPGGARDEFLLAATAQNLRKLAKLRSMPMVFA